MTNEEPLSDFGLYCDRAGRAARPGAGVTPGGMVMLAGRGPGGMHRT